jgi:hypothetical protein
MSQARKIRNKIIACSLDDLSHINNEEDSGPAVWD